MTSRYPSNFRRILERHSGCTGRLLDAAARICPEELDSSPEPEVVRIRKMVNAVLAEAHLLKAFVRLEPAGKGILQGYMRPEHDVWDMVGGFFARRFPGTVILLGNGTRGCATLYHDGSIIHASTGPLHAALEELQGIMGEDATQNDVAELWETYYRSQYCPERRNIEYYKRNMPARYTRAAGLGMETNTGNATLDDFIGPEEESDAQASSGTGFSSGGASGRTSSPG